MGRVGTRSGKGSCSCNKEGEAPYPTIPTTNPCPYALRSRSSQPAYAWSPRKHQLSRPAPPPASRRRRAAALTSSRRGHKRQQRLQTKEEEGEDDDDEPIASQEVVQKYFAVLAGEPAQLAIDYYKKTKEGNQLELTKVIHGCDAINCLGVVTHLQFQAEISDPYPRSTTVYAQIHRASYSHDFKKHASRVFFRDSPPEHPLLKYDSKRDWFDYPFDCPECGLDALDPLKSEDVLERLKFEGPE
ncbi:hypothetical protein Tsubulata_050773 [Turnera subulata]|uniref:Uncharacterized protein n=1 Tax=Turnera subulata TaxID=218843 RepID=A0A9Q0F872_9ROSI|nr:hypothetical protein Tsubulata_050773 [Turnera subulata]